MLRITYEDCLRGFNDYGYTLLTKEKDYKNTHSKVVVMDSEGYYGVISYDVFKQDHSFKPFSAHNPYTIKNIKKYLENNNIKTKLLSKEYFGLDYKLKFECPCGNEFEVSWHHFKCANQTKCRECNIDSYREKKANSAEDLNKVLLDNECIMFNGDYKSNKSDLHIIDKYGYKGITCYIRLKAGQLPMKFHSKNPYTLENLKHYIKINNIDCVLLSTIYKNNKKDKLEFMCSCGNRFKCSLDYFIRCNKTRCDVCMHNKSNIELKTEEWLIKNNIKFIFQYKIEGCKYKRALPFDFAVFKNGDLFGLIEVDGFQHYSDISIQFFSSSVTEKDKKDARLRDSIKTKYCKENNIKLLRLKEFYFSTDRYIRELKLFMFEGHE